MKIPGKVKRGEVKEKKDSREGLLVGEKEEGTEERTGGSRKY